MQEERPPIHQSVADAHDLERTGRDTNQDLFIRSGTEAGLFNELYIPKQWSLRKATERIFELSAGLLSKELDLVIPVS